MTPLSEKMLRAVAKIAAVLARFRKRTALIFLPSARLETLKRQEMEAERLDRLRNPSNYQGR
jgi:hypothetical protein